MKIFSSVNDVKDLKKLLKEAIDFKSNPYTHSELGKYKTIGLVFLNPSLRTRISTQRAAINLGMDVIVMNMDKDGWALETRDGVVMNGTTVEHIREAAAVMGTYCDILGLRSFPKLKDKEEDYSEEFFNKFVEYAKIPVVSLESATRHPLQSLADLVTITESNLVKPKVVLSWAPHVKPLPQAVPNSFSEWMCAAQELGMVDFTIACPPGYELCNDFTNGATIVHDRDEAIKNADFIYVKNWSSFEKYGEILPVEKDWMLKTKDLENTNNAKVMHCLPVRRDLELSSEILDGPNSIVIQQAGNRLFSAQAVLKNILENI
ncbi:acetylornithine carbamoyltransferase [Pedobacter flavus]|uniref:N-succinylornithine carbamoyltransferase n=1 Tax=Pedobacter flavus TaxID=3113906 RepID=A0ABU7GZV7_9SPHI|nr:acetylornithine carbamoyltransferase [Pedobacter sp. VNH31]MEE1884534.1 acetylornithine carbamoyltransferase [Pedobacter sp. VNH31]